MQTVQNKQSIALMYHRIGSPFTRSIVRGQYVLPGVLRWQLRSVLGEGYLPMTMKSQFATPGAQRHVSVTFDDGYATAYTRAFPLCCELGIPLTIFVVAGCLGGTNRWDEARGDCTEPMLDVRQLCELARHGVEIGAHTMTHAHLPELSDAALHTEIVDARHLLEDILGQAVDGFSYPYGDWDARVRDAVIAAGYRYAVTTRIGAFDHTIDRYAIPRVNMRWNTAGLLLREKIHRAHRIGESARCMCWK